MSRVSTNNKIPIVDFVGGELTLKSSFHDLLQSTLSNEGQDFPVAFIGILGGKESGKSFTGNLVHNYLSIHGLGLRTKLTTAIAQAMQSSRSEKEGVSGAVSIWEQPFLIEAGGKLIKVFMLEFASSEISEANHQEQEASLISFAKKVCSRLVEVVTYEKSRVLTPETLFNRQEKKLPPPSFSVVYVFQSCGYQRKIPKTLKDDINKISRILKSQVGIIQMEEIGDNTTPLILSSVENCISVIVNEDEISAKSGLTLETIEAYLTSCCGQVNTRFQPKLTSPKEPRRRRLSGSFGSWRRKSKKRTSVREMAEDRQDKAVEVPIAMPRSRPQSLYSYKEPSSSQQNSQDFDKYLEGTVVKFFNRTMSSILTEKQESFSAGQIRKIYALLCMHIFEIFPKIIGPAFDQLIILEEKLEKHFKQHQQTNMKCLEGKVRQVESIIHTFKTNYNNHRINRVDANKNSEEELAQYLKLKILAKVGPNEPIENHWACLKSQIDLTPAPVAAANSNLVEEEEQNQVYLGFQLNHKSLTMGIWKDGECVQLENERGELETPTVVGLTAKGRNLVYGSQVSRAEKKGTLASTYDIGKHFGRTSDTKLGEIFELPLKNKVSQVGIEFFLGYLFKKLKTCAERQIQIEISSCIITVPCHFASYQRLEVKYAAVAAGFQEVRVMSDTSAAAIEYALFSKESENSSFSNFRILCESNGNLYGGTCTFEKGATNISLKIGGKHFTMQGRTKVKYEKKAEVLYSYVTQLYQDLLQSGEGGSPNHVVLVLYEQPQWGRALTYVCNMNGSMTTEGSPLQGAIHKFHNFRGDILEMLPYKIQFLSEKGTFSSAIEEQHFAIEVHSQETYFSQQIFGRTTHPIGIVRLNQFYPEAMKYTISFERSEDGHISLEGLSEATRRSVKDLVRGQDFTWESGQNLLRSHVPEHVLLINKLFSRSNEEVKRSREQNDKVKNGGKKKEQNEVYRQQQHFIEDVCVKI